MPRGQLAHVAEDRVRRGDRVEREERLERVGVDLAARQRAQLGREAQLAADVPVVERLDPVAVAREHEAAARRVPDRDREHPAQPLGEAGAVLLVEVDEHLGVGVRAEGVAGALELVAQLGVVVDLAVLDDDDAAVLVRDRLVAAGEVDDREAPRAERDLAVDVLAAAVGAAVDELGAHRAKRLDVGVPVAARDPADPAHAPTLGAPAENPAARDCFSTRHAVATTVRR